MGAPGKKSLGAFQDALLVVAGRFLTELKEQTNADGGKQAKGQKEDNGGYYPQSQTQS
jgi:hypothetical protein